jgi:hypothetical protein
MLCAADGQSAVSAALSPLGLCCFHPWMHALVKVKAKNNKHDD